MSIKKILYNNKFVIIMYVIFSVCRCYYSVSSKWWPGIAAFFQLIAYILLGIIIIAKKDFLKMRVLPRKIICLLPTTILILSIFIENLSLYAVNFLYTIVNILMTIRLSLLIYIMLNENEEVFKSENKFLSNEFLCKVFVISELAISFFYLAKIETFKRYIFDFIIWIIVLMLIINMKRKKDIDKWVVIILIVGLFKMLFDVMEFYDFSKTFNLFISITNFATALEAIFIINLFRKQTEKR